MSALLDLLTGRGAQKAVVLITMATILWGLQVEIHSWYGWTLGILALVLGHIGYVNGITDGVILVNAMTDEERLKLKKAIQAIENDQNTIE